MRIASKVLQTARLPHLNVGESYKILLLEKTGIMKTAFCFIPVGLGYRLEENVTQFTFIANLNTEIGTSASLG